MTESTTNSPLMYLTSADSGKPTGGETPADALGATKRMTTNDGESQESYECPTCSDELDTKHGLKVHHAHVHDESLTGTTDCEWCGEEFSEPPSRDRTFCSYECRSEHRAEHGLPGRKRRTTITCEGCGDGFEVRQCESGRSYCSWECRQDAADTTTISCDQCGDEFRGLPRRRFCSQDCYGAWLSENRSGKNSQHWKGGYSRNRGTNWPKLRARTLEDYGYQCQGCGRHEDDHREEHGVGLSVHHIHPVTEFDEPADADTVDNLVPLCRGCHREWEGIPLRPELTD